MARRAGMVELLRIRSPAMSLSELFRLPRWLERAWQETRIDGSETLPAPIDPQEAETVPLPLHGALVHGD